MNERDCVASTWTQSVDGKVHFSVNGAYDIKSEVRMQAEIATFFRRGSTMQNSSESFAATL